jgi:hypothetical protein
MISMAKKGTSMIRGNPWGRLDFFTFGGEVGQFHTFLITSNAVVAMLE